MQAKSVADVSYSYNYLYSRKAYTEQSYNSTITINEMLSTYCPTGYALSIGEVGLYYVIDITYTEYEKWWWGTMVTGTPDKKLSTVGVNESNLILSFIFREINDETEQTYYTNY